MKNDELWAKTLLSVYRYLERIAGAIDKIILRSGLNSANIVGQNYFYNNVFTISQKLIDLSERKVTLINLKVLIEQTLAEMDEKDALILIDKFVDGVKTKDLVERHKLSTRTVFRKIDSALKNFAWHLCLKGYGAAALEKMLANENWLNNVHLRLVTKNDDTFTLSKMDLKNAVSL